MNKADKSKIPRLFELMSEKRITGASLARAIGLSVNSVSEWKAGRNMPSGAALKLIADYLETTPEYLLGATDIKENCIIDRIDVQHNSGVIGNSNSHFTINNAGGSKLTAQEKEIINIYRTLSEINKAKALIYLSELGE